MNDPFFVDMNVPSRLNAATNGILDFAILHRNKTPAAPALRRIGTNICLVGVSTFETSDFPGLDFSRNGNSFFFLVSMIS